MKSLFVFLLVFTQLGRLSVQDAFAFSRGRAPVAAPVSVPSPSPVPSASPTPSPVQGSGIVITEAPGYATTAEAAKIRRISSKLKATIDSPCFEAFMLKGPLIWTNGRSPKEVIAHLRSLSGASHVNIYYRCMKSWKCPTGTTAVAYRQPPERDVYLNRAVFSVSDPDSEWAETMAHEIYGHAWGEYDHSFNWTSVRDQTVPYKMGGAAAGDAIEACYVD